MKHFYDSDSIEQIEIFFTFFNLKLSNSNYGKAIQMLNKFKKTLIHSTH